MRSSHSRGGGEHVLRLDEHPEVDKLELDPFTFDLRHRPTEDLTPDERARAAEQLRRQLLEEILPHTIRPARYRRLSDVYGMIHRDAAKQPLHALCLSGGGIRSASFSFGVLQALADEKWLSLFHYLSTVSGGGYIGGWLSAWTFHDGAEDARRGLREKTTTQLLEPEAAPIRHLRTYANYLSPQLGLLSADTWTLIATYLRNLLLNWFVLIPLLMAAVLFPWICVAMVGASPATFGPFAPWLTKALLVLGVGFGAMAVAFTHRNRPDSSGRRDVNAIRQGKRGQSAFLKWCLAPLVLSVCFLSTAFVWAVKWELLRGDARLYFVGAGATIHALGYAVAAATSKWTWRPNPEKKILITIGEFLLVLLSGAGAGFLAYAFTNSLASAHSTLRNLKLYVWLAAPMFMLLVMLASFLFTGWGSRFAEDPEREWSARFAGWILIPVTAWLVVAGLALFGPDLIERLEYGKLISAAITLVTGGVVAGFGNSAKTSAEKPKANGKASGLLKLLPASTLLSIGALVFTAFLIVGLSMLGLSLVRDVACLLEGDCPPARWVNWGPLDVIFVAIALFGLGLLMARLIDTNKFSLHAMYRARLMRTFLGASRRGGERRPDPFTGFDEQDDLPMSALATATPVQRPMHVVNMALNLVSGSNLAWQNRKARSFTASPLHAGCVGLGYRRVKPPLGSVQRVYGGEPRGITLGTAMTISGAAASPNMGYHSSPLITFLMTMFNLRLGWWLGNPGPAGNDSFCRSQPVLAVRPIVDELFGRTNDRNKYVYLSDGGHFENLGVYEMVLRRCSRIVVVDASCDADATFGDLANAMRLISIDLGVPITFADDFSIYARGNTSTPPLAYWAEGIIEYSAVDLGAPDGKIYYLKPTLYGREPRDVFSYAQSSEDFPHESTADQFFSESQLESYRALGRYIGAAFISELKAKPEYPASRLANRLP
jgi:hypothetical protein